MMQSLLFRSFNLSLKKASLSCCRGFNYNYAYRSTQNQLKNLLFHQHSRKTLGGSAKLNLISVRTFLTHDQAGTIKGGRFSNKDGIPDSYELIYCIPSRMGLKLGYCGVLLAGCIALFVLLQTYILHTDEPLKAVSPGHLGVFDDERLLGLQPEDLPILLVVLTGGMLGFYLLITRMPYRIYRSNVASDRHYLAVFLNKFWPWGITIHEFQGADKLKFNFFTRYMFYLETYKLGSKKAILFPSSFRSAYDHDELIDFQLGKSFLNVKKDIEMNERKYKT